MATNRQGKANRNNAKTSTGRPTEEGKKRVRNKALRHERLARDAVTAYEDPADFDRQLCALEDEIRPKNALEFALVRQMADAQWRRRRVFRFTAACRNSDTMPNRTQVLADLAGCDGYARRAHRRAMKMLVELRNLERQGMGLCRPQTPAQIH